MSSVIGCLCSLIYTFLISKNAQACHVAGKNRVHYDQSSILKLFLKIMGDLVCQ